MPGGGAGEGSAVRLLGVDFGGRGGRVLSARLVGLHPGTEASSIGNVLYLVRDGYEQKKMLTFRAQIQQDTMNPGWSNRFFVYRMKLVTRRIWRTLLE